MSESLPEHPVDKACPRPLRSRAFCLSWRSAGPLAAWLWREATDTPNWLWVPLLVLLEFGIEMQPERFAGSMMGWMVPLLLTVVLLTARMSSGGAGGQLVLAWLMTVLHWAASWLWALVCLFQQDLCPWLRSL
ncbi:MAG: hypothetical protein OXF63_03545 [Anaerolineaceae bacterium]|nr:hypothetical protein [Anaerolineaceae bacterium]